MGIAAVSERDFIMMLEQSGVTETARHKRVLVLAHSLVGDDVGVNTIPAGMVKSVKRLK